MRRRSPIPSRVLRARLAAAPQPALLPLIVALLLASGGVPGRLAAQEGGGARRFERAVVPGAAGPNRLDPDVALLAGAAAGLDDLRLSDGAGREVPYLLVPPAQREPRWREGRLLRITPTRNSSGFEVDLGAMVAIDRLRLEGLPAPFLKRFRLEGGGDRGRWTELVGQGTLFDLPAERLSRTEVDFPALELRYLRVAWDDRASAVVGLPARAAAREARPLDPPAAVKVPVDFARRESEPGKSRFHLRLPGARLPVVALELSVGGGNLLRRVEVTQGRLGNGEVIPVAVGEGILRRAVRGDLAAADLRLPISALEGPELDLAVDDGDNPPLALTGATAELAPLPWIFFEAKDTSSLTARYGDPRAAAPRYDLEAMRESLGRIRPAVARWGAAQGAPAVAPEAAPGPLPTQGAPLAVASFRYRRAVPGPAEAERGVLTSLLLDAAVLAHSPGLADLRLADAAGRQIPYLVEKRSEPLALSLPALRRLESEKGEPGTSRYRLELPYATLPGARLVLATPARVFERQVRLVRFAPPRRGAGEGREEPAGETVGEAVWRHADTQAVAPKLVLDLPADASGRLEVRIDDGDNAPLPLAPPRLLLPAEGIRFFHPGGAVELLYGRADLAPPRYDLALLAPQLLGAAAREVSLQPEAGSAAGTGRSAVPRWAFWGALGFAVLALLVVLGRLLRDSGKGAAP